MHDALNSAGMGTATTAPNKVGRTGFGVALVVLTAFSWLNSSTPSFHPAYAPLKLLIGLVHFVVIGAALRRLLQLQRPTVLATAHDALLGQIACITYVYARSTLANLLSLPGISTTEIFAVEALVLWLAFKPNASEQQTQTWTLGTMSSASIVHLLWLGWLFAIAALKLDLHYTPSSDPDTHAFYAKVFLEHGRIYYDLLPNSDSWMIYPSAFGVMNFVLAKLSGLHPVQVVNISVYFQLALFAGASFSAIASLINRRETVVALAVLHFASCYLIFNAVFVERRMYLPGTPRLAHTALLIFPLLFAMQHRKAIHQRGLLFCLPFAAVLVGLCINPSHAPAALLFGVLAFAAVKLFPGPSPPQPTARPRSWAQQLAAATVLVLMFIGSDPFYRNLVEQQIAPAEDRELATDLTGGAFGESIDFAGLLPRALPKVWSAIIDTSKRSTNTSPTRVLLLLALVGGMVVIFASMRLAKGQFPSEANALLRFSVCAVVALAVHALWSETTPQFGQANVLQTELLVRYTHGLQRQINLLFFSIAPATLVGLVLASVSTWRTPEAARSTWIDHGTTIAAAALCIPLAYTALQIHQTTHIDALRRSPLGEIYASDVEFAQRVEAEVGDDGRVLLPGRSHRTRHEHWILTNHAGRAIPLYSNVKTSFFFGLDGWAFTAGAYQTHVAPPHFDPVWLRAQKVLWLVESGNFPLPILNAFYERRFGNDHAVLWRLRE